MKRQATIAILISAIICTMLLVNIPETRAQPVFIMSGLDDYDEYGQGIDYVSFYENSTGAWVLVESVYTATGNIIVEWNTSIGIYISVATWYNSTFTGATDTINGTKYLKHTISVINSNGTNVFSQNNFTYASVNDFLNPPMWRYAYYVIVGFLPAMGEIYTVTVTYEVFGVWA